MQLEPGMRVRCIDGADTFDVLKDGDELTILSVYEHNGNRFVRFKTGSGGGWFVRRFKPVIRVKAPTVRI